MVVSTELVPCIVAFNADDPASAVLAAELKVRNDLNHHDYSSLNALDAARTNQAR